VEAAADESPAGGVVEHIRLMRSELGPDGAKHFAVAEFALSG